MERDKHHAVTHLRRRFKILPFSIQQGVGFAFARVLDCCLEGPLFGSLVMPASPIAPRKIRARVHGTVRVSLPGRPRCLACAAGEVPTG